MAVRTEPQTAFYVTGGTLPPDATSYVEREADKALLSSLLTGEYCYVLNSRQMGKSSLSVRTIARLREEGVRTAFVDLTRIGAQNVSAEQWYAGLLAETGRALELRTEFLKHWKEHLDLPPVQRYFGAIREVALAVIDSPFVIFIDEIDAVRSLSFSADEFFAAVRACHNARTEDAAYKRLTFCLVGSATPADLISDTRMSPFNIGRRIELRDFTRLEAGPLAKGLGKNGGLLLERVLYWTGGHPYLTQRLCRACVEGGVKSGAEVDSLCRELFLTHTAQESDDNLSFVRNRLLRSEADLAALLDMYARMRAGKSVPDDETNPLTSVLKLSGVASVEAGQLRVRNRIYQHVFDRQWVEAHMPGAELRRQRAAYRRGMVRAASVSAVVVLALASLAMYAAIKARQAQQAQAATLAQKRTAELYLYVADMNVAKQAWDSGNASRALQLLEAHRPKPGEPDLRGFEWYYLWKLCQGDSLFTYRTKSLGCVAYSPDGLMLVVGRADGAVVVFDAARRAQVRILKETNQPVKSLSFSPDGKYLASTTVGPKLSTTRLWETVGWRPGPAVELPSAMATTFSPDGRTLAVATADGKVVLCSVPSLNVRYTIHAAPTPIFAVAYSRDGSILATGELDHAIHLWNSRGRPSLRGTLTGHEAPVLALSFSPDGRMLASGAGDSTVRLWATDTFRARAILRGHRNDVMSVAFSPTGDRLASGAHDGTVMVWDTRSLRKQRVIRGHDVNVNGVAFSPDASNIASVSGFWDPFGGHSGDNTDTGQLRVWAAHAPADRSRLARIGGWDRNISLAPSGRLLATDSVPPGISVWRLDDGRPVARLAGAGPVCFSPDGKYLLTGSAGADNAILWETGSWRRVRWLMHAGNVARFDATGRRLVTANPEGQLQIWRSPFDRPELLGTDRPNLEEIELSPDGTRLATKKGLAGMGSGISLWDVAHKKQISRTLDGGGTPATIAFSPDGSVLMSFGTDTALHVWNASTGRPAAESEPMISWIFGISFSPDGRTMATPRQDGLVTLWNVPTRRELFDLPAHAHPAISAAFSRDGTLLVSSGMDKLMRLWRAASSRDTAASPEPDRALVSEATTRPTPGGAGEEIHVAHLDVQGDARATIANDHDATKVTITNIDDTNWHVQLVNEIGTLKEGEEYYIRFQAKADHPRAIHLGAQGVGGDWPNLGFAETAHLERGWQPYAYVFRPRSVRAHNRVPSLILGTEKGAVWIRGLSVGLVSRLSPAERRQVIDQAERRPLAGREWLRKQTNLLRSQAARVTRSLPRRDPHATADQIDLTMFYNALLTESFHQPGHQPASDLSEAPRGLQTVAGTRFDIRGVVQLALPLNQGGRPYPDAVGGIRIRRNCRRLVFLQASGGDAEKDGVRVGEYVVHYANSETRRIPIVYGRDVRDWYVSSDPKKSDNVAWVGENDNTRNYNTSIRLFRMTWDNPLPTIPVVSIDFVSAHARQAPFLVAITAE